MSSKKPLRVTSLGPGDLPHHNDPQTQPDEPEIDDQDWIEFRLQYISDFVEEFTDDPTSIQQVDNLIAEICMDIRKSDKITTKKLHHYGAWLFAVVMTRVARGGEKEDFFKWMEERSGH